jgi:type IV secretion system protein VirB9
MKLSAFIAVLPLMVHSYAVAEDERIRTVQYDPSKVVTILTGIGNPTLIQFEEDELITDNKGILGMGDAKAWSIGAKNNNIVLKPIESRPDTKMVVVTNKRSYAFQLKSASAATQTMILRFEYPDTSAKAASVRDKKLALLDQKFAATKGKAVGDLGQNINYMKQGDESLAPRLVYDDGTFTYFTFDSKRDLPLIYKVLPDGSEMQTNTHMQSDKGILVVHETAEKFMLRLGDSVMAIRNDGFNPGGNLNLRGTTIPHAIRLQKGEL